MDDISNDDDVARLFRENDDIGSDSSLWLRSHRQFLKDGKPIGQLRVLTVSPGDDLRLPFGVLTETRRKRLVFWPILPSHVNMTCAGETLHVCDHITVELRSEKIHLTAYNANDHAVHLARAWRAHHFPDCDSALCFILLVRLSILRQQHKAVQRRIRIPITDKERRENEFARCAQRLRFWDIPLPPCEQGQDYIYFGLFLVPPSITEDRLSRTIVPTDSSMRCHVDGWADGHVLEVARSVWKLKGGGICIAAACPPGKLRSEVIVGLCGGVSSGSTSTS